MPHFSAPFRDALSSLVEGALRMLLRGGCDAGNFAVLAEIFTVLVENSAVLVNLCSSRARILCKVSAYSASSDEVSSGRLYVRKSVGFVLFVRERLKKSSPALPFALQAVSSRKFEELGGWACIGGPAPFNYIDP